VLLITALANSDTHQHSLSEALQLAAILALGPVFLYVLAGRLMAAQSPGGNLSWTGRRWQRGAGLTGAAMSSMAAVYLIARAVPLSVTVPLWALLGYGVILGVRWLWRDWKKEQHTREAEFQKLEQEGKTYSPPRLAGVNKFWRWILNGYAIVLVLAVAYALIRYLASPK
jgi:hypothetical protein